MKSEHLAKLKGELAKKFEAGLRKEAPQVISEEERVKKVGEYAEILFRAALRNLGPDE